MKRVALYKAIRYILTVIGVKAGIQSLARAKLIEMGADAKAGQASPRMMCQILYLTEGDRVCFAKCGICFGKSAFAAPQTEMTLASSGLPRIRHHHAMLADRAIDNACSKPSSWPRPNRCKSHAVGPEAAADRLVRSVKAACAVRQVRQPLSAKAPCTTGYPEGGLTMTWCTPVMRRMHKFAWA